MQLMKCALMGNRVAKQLIDRVSTSSNVGVVCFYVNLSRVLIEDKFKKHYITDGAKAEFNKKMLVDAVNALKADGIQFTFKKTQQEERSCYKSYSIKLVINNIYN